MEYYKIFLLQKIEELYVSEEEIEEVIKYCDENDYYLSMKEITKEEYLKGRN